MGQAALTRRAREAFFDGADDARRAIGDHQQGIAKPARTHVLEERPHGLSILLRAGHQIEQNLAAIFADAPGGDNRFTRLAGAQPLGNPVDIEVDDPILGQIALDKILVLRPQPFGDLTHRRARQQPTPAFVRKRILDVPG